MWRTLYLLLLLTSIIRGQFQIHFEESEYTFPESSTVCVRVRNVGGPASEQFSISYEFDPVLIGQSPGAAFPATQLFRRGASSVKLCLPTQGNRDNHVCESDTHGTITLINSSVLRVVDPYVTRITITDDEFVFASFRQPAYTFLEGSGSQHLTLAINIGLSKSINFNLTPGDHIPDLHEPELDASSPLALVTGELSYEPGHRSAIISVKSIDNELALEQPQHISFAIVLSSSECYDLTTTPTTITILDNDVVRLGFTSEELSVRESEGEVRLCVSISHVISRPLNFIIVHDSITAENQGKGGSILGQFPAYSNSTGSCYTVPFLSDDIIGNNRYFTARLDVDVSSYSTGVVTVNPSVIVNILDSSTCYDVDIVNSTEEIIEVPSLSSVCFHCKFKDDKSEDGDTRWQIGALILQSDIGEVLTDGTLQVTNTSSVFHSTSVTMMSCSSGEDGETFTFSVLLQGGHVIPSRHSSSLSICYALYHIIVTLTIIFIAVFTSL